MMRKLIWWALLSVLIAQGASAQYWAGLDNGIEDTPGYVAEVYGDSTWDVLLAGGSVKWIVSGEDSLLMRGIAQWDGSQWDSLPAPVELCESGNICSPVFEIFRYEGVLYANGSFSFLTSDGVWNSLIARWNESSQSWEALECINPTNGGMLTMLHVPPNDTMYFTGYLGSVCGYPESCVFAYDGSAFHPFPQFDAWAGDPGDYVGFVFRFQDRLYMTGLLDNPATGDFYGFLRYTGTVWEPVPGFTTPAPIKDVLIHDNKLYVCGYFFTDTGAPGNMVTVYDGEQWSDMGGGLRYALPNSTMGIAYDLQEWNGDIYVAGQFYYAGGVAAENVARWNGQQWCGMGGVYANEMPGGTVLSLTTWRDSLYIAGGFNTIDGDTLNNVAKWLGVVENCSPAVGVDLLEGSPQTLKPSLVDANGSWVLKLPENAHGVLVADACGRLVQRAPVHGLSNFTLDLRDQAIGVYFISCTTSTGAILHTKVFKP